jgi:hypothetical protein
MNLGGCENKDCVILATLEQSVAASLEKARRSGGELEPLSKSLQNDLIQLHEKCHQAVPLVMNICAEQTLDIECKFKAKSLSTIANQ